MFANSFARNSLFFFVSTIAAGSDAQELSRSAKAKQLFEQRCASAGERIVEKVENVDGIFLMRIRGAKANFSKQYLLDDPYGDDLGGSAYIQSFLKVNFDLDDAYRHLAVGPAKLAKRRQVGYEFVDALDPESGRRYRYTGFIEQPGKTNPNFSLNYYRVILVAKEAEAARPRYGVTFEDISTPLDRDYWIAGSSLKVIDLKENRVIAERVGYMYDPGQGNTSGGRSPWMMAASYACPAFPGSTPHIHRLGQSERFVEKVLVPKKISK